MKDDGGPAFPLETSEIKHMGMSLRDWFAGRALVVLAEAPTERHATGSCAGVNDIAEYAYRLADAMIRAGKK